jgi:hypothetical protein
MKASGRIGWTLAATALFVAACGGGRSDGMAMADSAAAPAAAQAAPESTAAQEPAATEPAADQPAARKPSAGTTPPATKAAAPAPSASQPGAAATGSQPTEEAGAASPAMIELRVPSGTRIETTLDQRLSTLDSKVGDRFTATVTEPVQADGRTAIPKGARIHGEVTAVQKSGSSGQTAVLKVDFKTVGVGGKSYPISAELLEAQPQKKSRTGTGEAAAKIGAGAVAGAIVGRIIGGNKTGTFIGAAVGAAAGTAIVLGTQDVDAVLPADSPMSLQLTAPLTVSRRR